jgi:hypothetical protein
MINNARTREKASQITIHFEEEAFAHLQGEEMRILSDFSASCTMYLPSGKDFGSIKLHSCNPQR